MYNAAVERIGYYSGLLMKHTKRVLCMEIVPGFVNGSGIFERVCSFDSEFRADGQLSFTGFREKSTIIDPKLIGPESRPEQ